MSGDVNVNIRFSKKLVIGILVLVVCAVAAYWYIPSQEQIQFAKELCQGQAMVDGVSADKCENREEWSKFLK